MNDARPLGDLAAMSAWLTWLSGRNLSPRTINLYGYGLWRLICHCRPAAWAEITEDDVAAFLASIADQAAAKSEYSRGIKSFFKWALRRGVVDVDPAAEITPKRPKRRPPVCLGPDELRRYLAAAEARDPRRKWALVLKFAVGTRTAELAGARPQDVEADGLRVLGKGEKERTVPLNDLARLALEQLRPWSNGTILGGISKQTLTAWGSQAARDSGLYPKLHHRVTHVLRASFITHLLRAGADVGVVRDLVGHENIATTSVYVAEASPQVQQETVGLLDRLMPLDRLAG